MQSDLDERTNAEVQYAQYEYDSTAATHSTAYILGPLLKLAAPLQWGTRVLDVGCGNGHLAGHLLPLGCQVVGIDLSDRGIEIARRTFRQARFERLAAVDNLLDVLGEEPFDLVVSTEVVEHLYDPRAFARGCYGALRSGGRLICSTPYHGYLKNLLLAVTGKFDKHWDPLWDGGHIKFWSQATLASLLTEVGFSNLRFLGAGRVPYLWKSMVVSATRP
jgi:2-polyprenyl-3-methyl-5-hydroxy-6-metoxy-1,4-benzoquinol methylase